MKRLGSSSMVLVIVCAMGSLASAQQGFGYGGFPVYAGSVSDFGGPVSTFGNQGYSGYGPMPLYASPWNDPLGRQQIFEMGNERYGYQVPAPSANYSLTHSFQRQAIGATLGNPQGTPVIRERFNAKTAKPKAANHAAKEAPVVPLNRLMSPDGKPLWPDAAPKNDERYAFDTALAKLAAEFKTEGKADVHDVNVARDALHAYGVPALAKIRKDRPSQAPAFKAFLNGMDATLTGWAKERPADQ